LGTPGLGVQFPRGQTALRRGHCGLVRRHINNFCHSWLAYPSLFFHFSIQFAWFRSTLLVYECREHGFSACPIRLRRRRHATSNVDVRVLTFLQYSLGIYILNGRGNWTEIFRLPLIYAAIMGISVNLA
jgi:hypothetical protein